MTVFGFQLAGTVFWGHFFYWTMVCTAALLILVAILQCAFGSRYGRLLNRILFGLIVVCILSGFVEMKLIGSLSQGINGEQGSNATTSVIDKSGESFLSEGNLVNLGLIFFLSLFFIHLFIIMPGLRKQGHEPADMDSLNIYNDWRKFRLECKGGNFWWAVLWGLHLACLVVFLLLSITVFP